MNNEDHIYMEFQNLFEVISEDKFHNLFKVLIYDSKYIEEQKLVEFLIILADKFEKFYNIAKLTETEKTFITAQLVKLSDFSSLNRINDLIGLMFSFADKSYCTFLRESLKITSLSPNMKIEITESVEEFEKCL